MKVHSARPGIKKVISYSIKNGKLNVKIYYKQK